MAKPESIDIETLYNGLTKDQFLSNIESLQALTTALTAAFDELAAAGVAFANSVNLAFEKYPLPAAPDTDKDKQ
jgi:hypothetical protein